MILFSIDHGIKRAFDSSSYKDIVEEFERVEKSESVLYDAENYDTIDIIDLILCSQDWIDKKFIFNLVKYTKNTISLNDKEYILFGGEPM